MVSTITTWTIMATLIDVSLWQLSSCPFAFVVRHGHAFHCAMRLPPLPRGTGAARDHVPPLRAAGLAIDSRKLGGKDAVPEPLSGAGTCDPAPP